MPAAIEYVAPGERDRIDLMELASRERRERRQAYEEALKYYDGDAPAQILLEEDYQGPDPNININLVKMTADRTVSFLVPDMPKFEIDPESIEPTDEEKWVKNFFLANGGLETLSKLVLRGFLSGHNFVKVSPKPLHYQGNVYPTVSVLDPTLVSVYWAADDVGSKLWFEQRYMVGNTPYIDDIIQSPDGETWYTQRYRAIENSSVFNFFDIPTPHGDPSGGVYDSVMWAGVNWEPVGIRGPDGVTRSRVIHPYWIPPIVSRVHLPHPNDYYGQSEFTQKDLINIINRLWSEISRIVHLHSDPRDVIIGADPDEVEGDGNLYTIDAPGAKVQRLSLTSGTLDEAVNTVNRLVETYLSVARVVLLRGEAKDLQRVTNASVRTLFIDMLSKNNLLQATYGALFSEIGELGIKMSNLPNKAQTLPVTAKFEEALPMDLTEFANAAAIFHQMGAWSLHTINVKSGVDPRFEAKQMEQEHEIQMERTQQTLEMQAQFTQNDEESPSGNSNNTSE